MKNEKYIYYSIEDLVIVFPKMIENSIIMEEVTSKSNNDDDELHRRRQKLVSKNLIVSYTKALRIFLGDGFPYLMIFKDALSVDAIQSIRDFDFPREIFKRRNKKYDKDEDEIILYVLVRLNIIQIQLVLLSRMNVPVNFFIALGFLVEVNSKYCNSKVSGNAMISDGFLDFSKFIFNDDDNINVMEGNLLETIPTWMKNSYDYYIENIGMYLDIDV